MARSVRFRFASVWLLALSSSLGACTGAPPATDAGDAMDIGGGDHANPSDSGTDTAIDVPTDVPAVCSTDVDCTDHVFCNGAERCMPGAPAADVHGCIAASPATPCVATQTCDEATSRCQTACDRAPDADGDGHNATACGGDDCDDADARRFPGNAEICDAQNHDEDCDTNTFGNRDADGDGRYDARCCNVSAAGVMACGDDCNDVDRTTSPTATEACDGRDNDCDGMVDEGVAIAGFVDGDGDLHGDPARALMGCAGLANFSPIGDDCDDADPARHPAQPEVCNLRDDDCDGTVDNGTVMTTWYVDSDGDGFGNATGQTRSSCLAPAGYSVLGTDCDDRDAHVHPGATEICDGKDDDCDGRANFRVATNDFEDDDGDGVADGACSTGPMDCDDRNPAVHPGAPEIGGDGVDENCNAMVDEMCALATWYVDADGDGWGDASAPTVSSCSVQAGHVTRAGDCDDAHAARNPAAIEACNGTDDDCDGSVDEGSDNACGHDHALFACVNGSCQLSLCELGRANCDSTHANGCEVQIANDPQNCGACGTSCAFSSGSSLPTCANYTCGILCASGLGDCDANAGNGCEQNLTNSPAHCGACGRTCPARPNANATCVSSACSIACNAGYADCDANAATGCEVHTDRDSANCGRCGVACSAGQICVAAQCINPAFASDGTEGRFEPSASVTIPPGIHRYTSIHIPAGVTVTTSGAGVIELRATGDVLIEGTIDVSGSRGGASSITGLDLGPGGGGATGTPLLPGHDWTPGEAQCLSTPGTGGGGANGGTSANGVGTPPCGAGGTHGGGNGGFGNTGGGGGGGFSGGGGGGTYQNYAGGDGGATTGETGGVHGAGDATTSCIPAGGGVAPGPYAGGTPVMACPSGGGGGSIGQAAASDLAVATTFRTGSGGGGGGGGYYTAAGGGGGGGGAVRIASATRITITATGAVLANGGAGGNGARSFGVGGGGGSGGVVYLAAPGLEVSGTVSAQGGIGGPGLGGTIAAGAAGGLGRVRFSTLAAECTMAGVVDPPVQGAACAPSSAGGTAGTTFIATYPN